MMHELAPFLIFIPLLLSWGHSCQQKEYKGITITRKLEEAIELGEKYLEECQLIESVARTEGKDAAQELLKDLHHLEHHDGFWNCLEESDSLLRTIPDTAEQNALHSRMRPYLEHLIPIIDEINRQPDVSHPPHRPYHIFPQHPL